MRAQFSTRWVRAGFVSLFLGVLVGLWAVPQLLRANSDSLTFATGHTLSNANGFLNFWREHQGERLLGVPISSAYADNGLVIQYFERGRLELHPELEGSPVLLGRVGAEYAEALWRTFPAPAKADEPGAYTFRQTGYSLNGPFLAFWREHDGITMLGYPISDMLWEYLDTGMVQVQYFERGRLEHYPAAAGTPDEVQISPLGRDLALMKGVDISTVAAPEALPLLSPTPVPPTPVPAPVVPAPAAAPAPRAAPAAQAAPARQAAPAAAKAIVVDIGDQWLYAYEDGQQVFAAPISTGRDGFNTPIGNFAVYSKLKSQTMSGTINGEYYNVPNVPSVMYIFGGVAIHGTYWHNQFGTGVRRSHGCINLPLDSAAWLYGWAPMGTPVTVRW
jgi:lipoprotein-anchoring transpeptidase ErfK/SrfK